MLCGDHIQYNFPALSTGPIVFSFWDITHGQYWILTTLHLTFQDHSRSNVMMLFGLHVRLAIGGGGSNSNHISISHCLAVLGTLPHLGSLGQISDLTPHPQGRFFSITNRFIRGSEGNEVILIWDILLTNGCTHTRNNKSRHAKRRRSLN